MLSRSINRSFILAPILLVSFLIRLLLLPCYHFGCDRSRSENTQVTEENKMTESEAILLASQKARELGYQVEKMRQTIKLENDHYIVYFGPKELVCGGDVTFIISRASRNIISIKRGQ